MKKILLAILLITNITTLSFALSDELKFDMKKTKFVKQMKEKNYSGALSTLKVLREIGRPLPSSILYFEGKALYETKNYSKAYDVLASYAGNGKKVKYYKDSVNLLISAEEAIEVQKKARLEARKKEKARIARKKEEERKARIVREKERKARIIREKEEKKKARIERKKAKKKLCRKYKRIYTSQHRKNRTDGISSSSVNWDREEEYLHRLVDECNIYMDLD